MLPVKKIAAEALKTVNAIVTTDESAIMASNWFNEWVLVHHVFSVGISLQCPKYLTGTKEKPETPECSGIRVVPGITMLEAKEKARKHHKFHQQRGW